MFYEFELDHNIVEATQNICCAKAEDIVDKSKTTRWFQKFYSQEPHQSGKVR